MVLPAGSTGDKSGESVLRLSEFSTEGKDKTPPVDGICGISESRSARFGLSPQAVYFFYSDSEA